ncbi:MAG: dihydropteroate synthase [Brucellaceae bacterium]|nr:dihydropteroate synthase [Brucellaceae bacterium]
MSTYDPFAARRWPLAHGRSLVLGPRAILMGILNVTPDSFSDGGRFDTVERALAQARAMMAEGAQIVDIGGESTRPGADPVDADEEQRRVLPVIEALSAQSDVLVSVDTYRAETARLAVEAGAHIVNDVWGLQRDPEIAAVVQATGAGVVMMHTGRERETAADVVADQHLFLDRSLEIAAGAGIGRDAIVLDPGFGFAKNGAMNLELMARFSELHGFGLPLLAGTSRKRFTGLVTGQGAGDRAAATAATSVILRERGAAIFRVHDVAVNHDALAMTDALLAAQRGEAPVRVAIGLGGNIGDPASAIARALSQLDAMDGISVVAVSPLYRTPPWGKTDQPDFLNACAVLETAYAPRVLLRHILALELDMKRQRDERWGPRTIDIDIIAYGDEEFDEPGLTVPHPRATERLFVMRPLADIAPDFVLAGQPARAHAELLSRDRATADAMSVVKSSPDWWKRL